METPRPDPETAGRVFSSVRKVRLGDVTPGRRARLDALCSFLQDVAEDDAEDAGLSREVGWLVRKTVIEIERFPVFGDEVQLETFCTATGPSWAERTTLVRGPAGASLRARSVWVAVEVETGRPVRLGEDFFGLYGSSAAGRRVSARLVLPGPPPGLLRQPWPTRASDYDVWGHLNNTTTFRLAEDAISSCPVEPRYAECEYARAVLPDDKTEVVREDGKPLRLWLLARGEVAASLLVS